MRGVSGSLMLGGAVALLVACGGKPTPWTATPEQLAFQGLWRYNRVLSDKPSRLSEGDGDARARPSGRSGSPPGRGGMGRRGGRGRFPGGGGRPSMEDLERVRQIREELMLYPTALHFAFSDSTITIEGGNALISQLFPDGRKVELKTKIGTIEVRTKWEHRLLVVERKYEGGIKLTDRYWMTEGEEYLYHAMNLEGGPLRRDVELKRTYQR